MPTTATMSRVAFAIVVAVTVLMAALSSVALAVEAQVASFVARPTAGSPTSPQGDWFLFDADPGQELTGSLALRNDGSTPIELRLDPVDAATAQYGGVEYTLPDEPLEAVGAWIDVARDQLRLDAGASAEVGFTIDVPSDAQPGDHLGGVAVWSPRDAAQGDAGEAGMEPGVIVQTRQVVAVQLTVPGEAAAELQVAEVGIVARPDGPYLEIAIDNNGQRLVRARGELLVDGEPLAAEFVVDTVVPRTRVAYPVAWPDADLGRAHEVAVRLDYDGGQAAWSGTVNAPEEVRAALEDWEAPGTRGVDVSALPWVLAALVALLAILLSLTFGRRRRHGPRPDAQLDSSKSS